MLIYFTSRLISSIVAFLYPGYASFKTLSQRPASEDDLERWLMYWSVLGCVVGVEYVAEWLVSWIPFYYPFKTLFFLYLALPQTRGSSYLYVTYLQPFLFTHEPQIDAALASLKTRIFTFLQERARALWEHLAASVNQPAPSSTTVPAAGGAAPPTLSDPVSGPTQMLGTFWRTYGPAIVASGAALLRQGAATSVESSNRAMDSPPAGPSRVMSSSSQGPSQSAAERKRQLEAELAALQVQGYDVSDVPGVVMPSASGGPRPSSSDSDLRERNGAGRFEEVEVPSDAEHERDERPGMPAPRRSSGWFGWGAGSPASQGYEKVKSD
ncbi:receptor expression-enhancing protein 4 [Artomyces pyxidatus]|uniref:Receptor expression-enhancing protein 4 n=1 Tax=Artomyces pyxidatus TaxID=48021 RepID=A0ACB8STW6_9AGAM|nr:receptor expression-enhancing protein 4 [Artomyces pyxidatus]